jgi:hypothetical protein
MPAGAFRLIAVEPFDYIQEAGAAVVFKLCENCQQCDELISRCAPLLSFFQTNLIFLPAGTC